MHVCSNRRHWFNDMFVDGNKPSYTEKWERERLLYNHVWEDGNSVWGTCVATASVFAASSLVRLRLFPFPPYITLRYSYAKERRRITVLQSLWRRKAAKKAVQVRRRHARARTIQTSVRRHLDQSKYQKARLGTIRLQAQARQHLARKAYLLSLDEAKEQVNEWIKLYSWW